MDYQEWVEQARCADADPDIFFPPKGEGWLAQKAIDICNKCPVILPCREYAIINDTSGVWGGWSQIRIRREKTKRGLNFGRKFEQEDFPNGFEKAVEGFKDSAGEWLPYTATGD